MEKYKKTKIVATIGPASDSRQKIKELILSGVDVFRFNTKHSSIEWHNERIKRIQKIAGEMGKNIGIMVDLQGSETRIETKDKKSVKIKKGDELIVADSFSESEANLLVIPDKKILKKMKKESRILVGDGLIELEVTEKNGNFLKVKVVEGGVIEHRKNLNFPGSETNLSFLIKKDIENLNSAAKNNVSFVALSFVNSAKDIVILRKEMKKRKMNAAVVSKIENEKAIENIDEIIKESDAVMIARGDLGIEVPVERLAYWQKKIIEKCREERKPVIVATQMLYSMIKNPKPTRAEATDVANAVFDGTDAVMLSEETAIGKYPVRSVSEMNKIVSFNEKKALLTETKRTAFNPIEFMVGAIAGELEKRGALDKLKIKTAIVFTETGYTARVLSAFRPAIKIVGITNTLKTAEKMSLQYGIIPYYASIEFNDLKLSKEIENNLKKKKIISRNEAIAVFHGRQAEKPNLLNLFSLTKTL